MGVSIAASRGTGLGGRRVPHLRLQQRALGAPSPWRLWQMGPGERGSGQSGVGTKQANKKDVHLPAFQVGRGGRSIPTRHRR